MIFQLLHTVFGDLKTWENWLDLYIIVFMERFGDKKSVITSVDEEPEFHPHCFTDLVHKTTLYFQAAHGVRLSFAEAQKRVSATTLALSGLKPTNEVKYHRFPVEDNDFQIDDEYWTNIVLDDQEDSENYKIMNTGQQASITFAVFRQKDDGLTKTMIDCARQQSKLWAKANNKNQSRDWHQIVSELCQHPKLANLLITPFVDLTIEADEDRRDVMGEWTNKVRTFVLTYLFEKENDVTIFQTELFTAIKAMSKGGKEECDTAEKFVNFCLYMPLSATPKKKKGKATQAIANKPRKARAEITQDGGMSLVRPPSPHMCLTIATIFSFLASGSKTSIDAIAKVASLNGDRVTDPRYKDDIAFLVVEDGFKASVSFECRIFVLKRKVDIIL